MYSHLYLWKYSTLAVEMFTAAGIPASLVLDSSVAMLMNTVDYKINICIVGAEGVIESGGIINKLGTYQMAIIAKAHQVPFYVAAESYKFARNYPLTTSDIQDMLYVQQLDASTTNSNSNSSDDKIALTIPTSIDYTPSEYITLLFTDLGILTPAAISDELIRMMM